MEGKGLLTAELKKHRLIREFWTEQIETELDETIVLTYEPVGDMGIYSKYFEFHAPYVGSDERLAGSRAVIRLGITAVCQEYDIEKAMAGKDCFHNVQVRVVSDCGREIECRFRLWDGEDETYCGSCKLLENILTENAGMESW